MRRLRFQAALVRQFVTNVVNTGSEVHPLFQCKQYFSHDLQDFAALLCEWFTTHRADWNTSPFGALCVCTHNTKDTHEWADHSLAENPVLNYLFVMQLHPLLRRVMLAFCFTAICFFSCVFILCGASQQRLHDLASLFRHHYQTTNKIQKRHS